MSDGIFEVPENPEALTWLKSNQNPWPLAGERFIDKEAAITFVNQLYELGAPLVEIGWMFSEEWRLQKDGGPYATSLIIYLPENSKLRQTLFNFWLEELERSNLVEELPEIKDEGQKTLLLWWD